MLDPIVPTVIASVGAVGLGFGQLFINYRLNQQDRTRDAARKEMTKKDEAANKKIEEIHVLVNSNLTTAQERISKLEAKLGLEAGEAIPKPPIVALGET